MLEVQLTQNESDPGGIDSNYIYIHIHKEIDAPKSKQDSLVTEEWNQPEEIENVVSLLTECDRTPGRNSRCSTISLYYNILFLTLLTLPRRNAHRSL